MSVKGIGGIGPLDDSVIERHRRMGLITQNGTANNAAVDALSHLFSGLFFDALCDRYPDMETVSQICRKLVALAEDDPRKTFLRLCTEYDAMRLSLPDPLWWISGSWVLVPPFIRGFCLHLDEILKEMEVMVNE